MARGLKVLGLTGGIGSGSRRWRGSSPSWAFPSSTPTSWRARSSSPASPPTPRSRPPGPRSSAPDGTLDRKRLAAIVFADRAARARLEAITHPRIQALAEERLAALAAQGHALAVYEASLLVESGRYKDFDGLVVVTASPETQLERVLARGGLTEAEAQARIDAQLPLLAKVRVATHLVDNDGELEATKAQVERLVASLK